MDYADFNERWLRAWSDKDVDALVTDFYASTVVYKDSQTAAGIEGSDALRGYLSALFQAMPPTEYLPDELWPLADGAGYCGRWIAAMHLGEGKVRRFRGFDLCILSEGKIVLNEVYTHDLPE